MDRQKIVDLMRIIVEKQGGEVDFKESDSLSDIGFCSLDFSELAVRVEDEFKVTLTFDASPIREITHVNHVIDFMVGNAGNRQDNR